MGLGFDAFGNPIHKTIVTPE